VDVWFFAAHKLMHEPWMYKNFHKMHHRYQAPEAITGVYCHPVEQIVVNACAMMVGPLLMASHPITWGVWSFITGLSVAVSHSGYAPSINGLLPNAVARFVSPEHDLHHHKQGRVNFGLAGYLCDRLIGTFVGLEDSLSVHTDGTRVHAISADGDHDSKPKKK
jgi:sterol desaturase/sphingolipid hydroxylase (fatty acid hydroxylase superfamily)